MSSRSKKRAIVVDGVAYRWMVGGSQVFVWTPEGRRREASVFEVTKTGWCDDHVPVTPFQVANWIRVAIQGKPPVARRPAPAPEAAPSAPARPVPVRAAQGETYLVVSESGDYDYYGWSVVEAHLDPQTARDRADALNTRERIRQAMCKALHAPIFEGYDTHLKAASDADRKAWSAACRERFFREHGVTDPGERAFIEGCPAEAEQPRYGVLRTRLYDAASMASASHADGDRAATHRGRATESVAGRG